MPGKDRATPDEAMLFLGDLRERLTIIALTLPEYSSALEESAAMGIMGGGVYDSLIGYCFKKSKAATLYTWNVKHFTRLGPAIAGRVKTP